MLQCYRNVYRGGKKVILLLQSLEASLCHVKHARVENDAYHTEASENFLAFTGQILFRPTIPAVLIEVS